MDRKLTINDFIYAYFTYYCNGKIQSSLYQSPGMMGEMNEIKEDYNNISGTWSNGTIITIEMVLRKCVRGVSSRGHQYCISSSAIGKLLIICYQVHLLKMVMSYHLLKVILLAKILRILKNYMMP